jgi:hypothetical protein
LGRSQITPGIPGRVFADCGLTVELVRDHVRERLGGALSSLPEGQLPFSPTAKDVLRSAYRFPEPKAEHILVALIGRGEAGASEILRARGADRNSIRFAAKKLASPTSVAGRGEHCGSRSARSHPSSS